MKRNFELKDRHPWCKIRIRKRFTAFREAKCAQTNKRENQVSHSAGRSGGRNLENCADLNLSKSWISRFLMLEKD